MWTTPTTQDPYSESDTTEDFAATTTEKEILDEDFENPWKTSIHYTVIVPILIVACGITIGMNVFIICAYPLLKHVPRVTKPYITFILSLLISDALASLLLGIQLLFGAYLPVVHNIFITGCIILVAEAFKLAIIMVTVLHLLVMVLIHLAGVTYPVKFKELMTQKAARWMVIILWCIPFAIVLILFSSIENQGFRSEDCLNHEFLMKLPFRATYSSLIILPTATILVIYALFHYLLWRKRDVSKSSVSKQNVRAAKTTILIMFTCTAGWLPAVVNHLLICEEGCRYVPQDFSINTTFIMHAVSYVLIILKSFSNPLIFALRQKNIREAMARLFVFLRHCDRRELRRYDSDSRSQRLIRMRAASTRCSSIPTITLTRPLLLRQQSSSSPNIIVAASGSTASLKSAASAASSTFYCSSGESSLRNKVLLMQTEEANNRRKS